MQEPRWNCAFLRARPTRQLAEVPGCLEPLPEERKLYQETGHEQRHLANSNLAVDYATTNTYD